MSDLTDRLVTRSRCMIMRNDTDLMLEAADRIKTLEAQLSKSEEYTEFVLKSVSAIIAKDIEKSKAKDALK